MCKHQVKIGIRKKDYIITHACANRYAYECHTFKTFKVQRLLDKKLFFEFLKIHKVNTKRTRYVNQVYV